MNQPTDKFSADQHLVDKVIGGDNNAFTEILKRTEALVAQIVFKMVDNRGDRQDIAQDIFLKVFKNLPGFRFEAKLSTWIGQIAYNTCINYLEKKKLVLVDFSVEGNSDSTEGFLEQAVDNEKSEELVAGRELSVILSKEIDRLPIIYKTLIALYHQQELSYNEITQIMSLPEGTVKSYLFRARKALKENILLRYKKEDL
jgi:RNA polymerase sigma-70 factor (ECF subfamily)